MRNDFESNYLAHHGILGQKWGKKNGPPYPLDTKDHSSSEKKAGWRESLKAKNEERKKQKQAVKYKKEMQRHQTNIEYYRRERIRPLAVAEENIKKKGLHDEADKYRRAAKVLSGIKDWDMMRVEGEYDAALNGLIKQYGSDDFMKVSNKSIERGQKKIDRLFKESNELMNTYKKYRSDNMAKEIQSEILKSQKDIDAYKKAYSDENYYYQKRYWADSKDKSNKQTEKLRDNARKEEEKYFNDAIETAKKVIDKENISGMSEKDKNQLAFSTAVNVFYDIQKQALNEDKRDTSVFEKEYDRRNR